MPDIQVCVLQNQSLYLPFCFYPQNIFASIYQWGFPGGSEVKASASSAGDPGSIPGLGRSPGEGNGNPLQYSCLENPMDGEAWCYSPWGNKESDTTELLHSCISGGSALRGWKSILISYLCPVFTESCREGNGNPLQYSCLENSVDRGD